MLDIPVDLKTGKGSPSLRRVFNKAGGVRQVHRVGYKPSHHKKGNYAEWMRDRVKTIDIIKVGLKCQLHLIKYTHDFQVFARTL